MISRLAALENALMVQNTKREAQAIEINELQAALDQERAARKIDLQTALDQERETQAGRIAELEKVLESETQKVAELQNSVLLSQVYIGR